MLELLTRPKKLKVGEFSRGGKARGRQAKKAGDHDMNPQATLVPFGILETTSCQLFTVFGTSRETSVSPIVRFVDKAYEKGVRLSKKSFRSFSSRLKRSDSLPKWSLEIPPVAAESI